MTKRILPFLATAAALAAGCDTVEGSGDLVTEVRSVNSFERVSTTGAVDADITVGEDRSLVLTCDDNLIDQIITEVVEGELVIRLQPGILIDPQARCFATLSTPTLLSVETTGEGDLDVQGDLAGFNSAVTTGPGDIGVAGIDTKDLLLETTGEGSIVAAGEAETLEARTTGAGDIDARDLFTVDADVTTTGAGDIVITATGVVDARTSASGDIDIYGDPDEVNETRTGSGEITVH